jgi:DNA-binding NtrC family response regulator
VAESRSPTNGWDASKKPPGLETELNSVLCVSPNSEDCASLQNILKSGWAVIGRATVASALSILREIPIPIVICDCDVFSGGWEEMLARISLLPDPPLLIVASRLADARLWAEALNLGAWDVLAKPFDAEEVVRTLSIAGQHWQNRHGPYQSHETKGTRKRNRTYGGNGNLALVERT